MDIRAKDLVATKVREVREVSERGPFHVDWGSLGGFQTPSWYEDGKFGIFIHWGPYCVPAFGNEWYPRNMYQKTSVEYAYHRAVYGPQDKFGYKDFLPMFRAEQFDAEKWAALFRRSGARFVVPVAEHHDGFPMYNCSFSRWNAVQMGPRRDVVGELAAAVRAAGLVFGLSSHRIEHWWFMNGGRDFPSDVQDPAFEDFYGPAMPRSANGHDLDSQPRPSTDFMDDWLARTCELVDRYQPQLVWFDWWIQQKALEPYLKTFAAYYYNRGGEWNKGVAINYKFEAYPENTAVMDIERGQLTDIRRPFWQTDTSVSRNSWGYITHHDYKTAGAIIHDLVDIVSKNGALLLNIGPKADGTIPAEEEQMLTAIGGWLAQNGEAIYGTRPWLRCGEGPTAVPTGHFTDTHRQPFTSRDVRYTQKDGALYAVILGRPAGEAVLQSLPAGGPLPAERITRVSLLGAEGSLPYHQTPDGLVVQVPAQFPGEHAFTIKIEHR